MRISNLLLLAFIFQSCIALRQEKKVVPNKQQIDQIRKAHPEIVAFGTSLVKNEIIAENDVRLEYINTKQLQELILKDTHKLKSVIITTSGCSGPKHALAYLDFVRKNYSYASMYLIFTSNFDDISTIQKLLFTYKYSDQAYIVDPSYKMNVADSRERGFNFRNELDSTCKEDIIGVPYYLLFDTKGTLIMHGYPSFIGPLANIPSDYIKWFNEH